MPFVSVAPLTPTVHSHDARTPAPRNYAFYISYTLFLARSPDHRHELLADPGLIPGAVEELIRRFPVVSLAREVRHDMEYDGVQLKKGDMVAVPTPLAGTDARLNPQPLKVDFHRPSADHVTFGNGPHVCPGAHLASTEDRITIEEWLARIPEFEVAPNAEIHFRGGLVGVVDALPLVWDVATTRWRATA